MRDELKRKLQNYSLPGRDSSSTRVPPHLHEGILRYVCDGIPPGAFMNAVITNDLRGAFEYGDDKSIASLHAIVAWFYNHAPSGCWGSTERMIAWTRHQGLAGVKF